MSGMLSTPANIARDLNAHDKDIKRRRATGGVWLVVFYAATTIAVLSLISLILNIADGAFGYVAVTYTTDPKDLEKDGVSVFNQSADGLRAILMAQTDVFLNDSDKGISPKRLAAIADEKPLDERSREDLLSIVEAEVLHPHFVKTWNLTTSLFDRTSVTQWMTDNAKDFPNELRLEFRSWVTGDFIVKSQSPDVEETGIRTALLGSAFIILITILFAFPIGVAAAVYLEEFSNRNNRLVKFVQLNIYNLAAVPSIIYGMLGLAIFVRGMVDVTQGRTILSASLTLAVLVLPIIIINSQEAIRAVPKTLRDSSMGLGATKWQTVWHHVLPGCFDRILTGTILAISRAVGETAPLVVIGAATFIQRDPEDIFSAFTALPIQVYQLIARPQEEYRHVAAAAIIVLLILLLAMNATAIILRDRISKRRRLS